MSNQHRDAWVDHIAARFGTRESKSKPLKLTPYAAKEGEILSSILEALVFYPCVAWFERVNNGAHVVGEGKDRRYIRYGWPGCSDIIGMLKPNREGEPGRFLAIEVKTFSGRTTEAQEAFLNKVRSLNGCAGIVRSVDDLSKLLRNCDAS